MPKISPSSTPQIPSSSTLQSISTMQSQLPPPTPMDFFVNAQYSPMQVPLHDITKNPKKFTPRYFYEESRMMEDHIKIFKEIYNTK